MKYLFIINSFIFASLFLLIFIPSKVLALDTMNVIAAKQFGNQNYHFFFDKTLNIGESGTDQCVLYVSYDPNTYPTTPYGSDGRYYFKSAQDYCDFFSFGSSPAAFTGQAIIKVYDDLPGDQLGDELYESNVFIPSELTTNYNWYPVHITNVNKQDTNNTLGYSIITANFTPDSNFYQCFLEVNGQLTDDGFSHTVNSCVFHTNTNIDNANISLHFYGDQHALHEGDSDTYFYSSPDIPPVINTIANATLTDGDTYSVTSSFTDPDSNSWIANVDYGDGSGTQPLTLSGKNFVLSHQYTTVGTYTVTVNVTDNQGAISTVQASITVNSAPPQINPLSGSTITQGDTYSENGSFTDADSTLWTATVDYGDGSGVQPLTLNSDNMFSLNHQYTTEGTYTVTVNVTDNQGATGTGTATVIVNSNAIAPVVGQITSNPSPVKINTSTGFSANFTDANTSDTHTASWNWGDVQTSSGTVTESNGSGSVNDNHTYTALGSYPVTLTVTDSTNLSSTAQSVIAVIPTGGLTQANLSHTNYNGASFSGLNLTKVNGTNAQFQNVDFSSATLTQSNFSNSNLTGSNFTNANLNKANLSNSNLTNVNFTGANLTQANLSNSTRTRVVWSNTICPNGQNSDNHNNSCAGQGGGL